MVSSWTLKHLCHLDPLPLLKISEENSQTLTLYSLYILILSYVYL